MLIDILALDGVFDTGLAAVQDTFAIAAELSREQRGLSAPVLTRVVGVRRGVTTANGLKVPTQMASALSRPDVIVVPALGAKTPQTLAGALGHVGGQRGAQERPVRRGFHWLRRNGAPDAQSVRRSARSVRQDAQ